MLDLTSRIALLEIGRIAGIEEREAQDIFAEARAVAEQLQDKAGHAFLLTLTDACAGSRATCGSISCVRSAPPSSPRDRTPMFEFEMRSVLAHAQLAVGRLAPARATAERALAEVARAAGLREEVGRSTAPGLCRVWWALASAHLGRPPRLRPACKRSSPRRASPHSTPSTERTAFLGEVLRLRGDLPGALAHGRRAVELAEERGSLLARVEAAAFLGAAELAAGDVAGATRLLEPALASPAIDAPRCGTSRASWRRSRTRSSPPVTARSPRAPLRGT